MRRSSRHLRTHSRRLCGRLLAAGAAALFVLVGSGGRAQAAVLAVGVDDQLTAIHDRTAVVAAPGVLANDTGLVGSTTAILVSNVSHGTLSLRSDGGYTYQPGPGFVGSDSFRYRPSGLVSTAATVTITVTNRPPVATANSYSVVGGNSLLVTAPGVLADDTDPDGDALVAALVAGPVSGTLDFQADGGFNYQPAGFVGTASFSYRASDGLTSSAAVTVTITVTLPATPQPTPTPTPTPPPAATPRPQATPTPTPRPSPGTGGGARESPSPPQTPPAVSSPQPTASPAAGSPAPSQGAAPAGNDGTPPTDSPAAASLGGAGGIDGSTGPAGGTANAPGAGLPRVAVRAEAQAGGIQVQQEGLLGVAQLWFVPAGLVSGSGLLVLLLIALEYAAGAIWVPAARRFRGKDQARQQRPRSMTARRAGTGVASQRTGSGSNVVR